MNADHTVVTELPHRIDALEILEDTSANQESPVDYNTTEEVCNPEPSIAPTLFTVGLPGACLDALSERKSFRDSLRALHSQSTIPCSSLCLSCRQVGHVLKECPYLTPSYFQPLDWTLATSVHAEILPGSTEQGIEELCSRCEALTIDLHGTAEPIEKSWPRELKFEDFERSADWITLGPAASLLFQASCSFCRLLFSITRCPYNRSEELIVTKTDSIRRLGASRFLSKFKSAACAYTTIKPTEVGWNKSSVVGLTEQDSDNAVEAICCLSKDCLNDSNIPQPLEGRIVDNFSINEPVLRGWLQRCDELHGEICKPDYWHDELREIRLVDVISRQVVPYPSDRCDYIALSYVWGECEQRSYKIGSYVEKVPQTIEDAMTVVKILGKRYLWVDSLTIDQSDSAHKAAQIDLMSSIYRCAWATIVALAGRSASSGLPRVNTGQKLYPDVVFPQASATLNGIQFVSTLPTLAQQMHISQWATRAWTLQEALLSPRCLYFTQHQVYFQCNTFQCCESIDDTTSSPHNEELPAAHKFGTGVLQSSFLRPSHDQIRSYDIGRYGYQPGLRKYYELLGKYSARKMTSNLDRINAFSGILQALESLYFKERGFHYGLPVSELPWSLLWEGDCSKPIIDFPSWSWAGWEITWMYSAPPRTWFKKDFPTYLQIVVPKNGLFIQIYQSPTEDIDSKEWPDLVDTDPLWPLARKAIEGPPFVSSFSPDADIVDFLFIEGIMLTFICPSPAEKVEDRTDWNSNWKFDERDLKLGNVKCTFRYLLSLERTLQARLGQPQTFLVIARDLYEGKLTYCLLLLDEVGSLMYRHSSVQLTVPYNDNYCIKHANPRRTWLVLG